MQARSIPPRHEVKEPHRVGSASYLEASACAPPLNALNGSRSSSQQHHNAYAGDSATAYHDQMETVREARYDRRPQHQPSVRVGRNEGQSSLDEYDSDGFAFSTAAPYRHIAPSTSRFGGGACRGEGGDAPPWQHQLPLPPPPFPLPGTSNTMMPDAPWPMPDGLPQIPPPPPGYRFDELFPEGLPGMASSWPSPADLQMPEVFPFPPPYLPPPPFPMPWGQHGDAAWGGPRQGDGRGTHRANQRESTVGSSREGALHHDHGQRPPTIEHRGAVDDLPWLAPPHRDGPSSAGGTVDARGGATAATTSWHPPSTAGSSWPPQRRSNSAASHAEEDRLRALAENARRHFIGARGGASAATSSTAQTDDEDTGDMASEGDATDMQRRGRNPRPTGEQRTYRVQSDYRATTGARLTPEEQIRLKQEREARINARRNSVHNRSSSNQRTAMRSMQRGGGAPTTHPTRRSSSGTGAHPQGDVAAGVPRTSSRHRDVPTDEGSTSSRYRADAARTEDAVLQSSNGASAGGPHHRGHARGTNSATAAGVSPKLGSTARRTNSAAQHTPHRLFPTANESSKTPLQARRAARGVTISALKGETPDLKRALRDGLPSEQQRLRDFRLQRASQRNGSLAAAAASPPRGLPQGSNDTSRHPSANRPTAHQDPSMHHTSASTVGESFIGFGAAQYTPFVELAKKDPRAAEYLQGIEQLYHNLRKSYETFQRHPEQFLKGPSLTAIQQAVRSPPRQALGGDNTQSHSPPAPTHLNGVSSIVDASRQHYDLGNERANHPSVTPPRLPMHDLSASETFLARDAEPSAETRMLREELDRLEHQWQKLSELRGSGESGAGPVEAIPPSAHLPTKGSVTKKVRDQLQLLDGNQSRPSASMSPPAASPGSRSDVGPSAAGDVFSYENVMGFVRERKMLHQQQQQSMVAQ